MSFTRIIPAGLLAGLLLAAWPLPAPAQPDTKPAIAPADANVPQSVMGELEQTFQPPIDFLHPECLQTHLCLYGLALHSPSFQLMYEPSHAKIDLQ